MATKSVNMKGFYRERKGTKGGISKNSSPKRKKPSSKHVSPITQPAPLISHASLDLKDDEYDKNEDVLRQFDMNVAYGPCCGMSRLERLERAHRLGLNPPKEIENLLKAGKVGAECLWAGRI
ncbi:DNA_pol_delta_4 domain-containing protein [Cephalotus follicularis]|uniref:DNA_pol_delta_4 domain-containing protein n=1 Tax=Cephalotus follicularis TaxID=3775 RepID=A0A1Q3D4C2_CEPFO|nr:DNA_pol_delta_4 domain-containing protein [Cephalotus follicularis]